MNNNPKTDHLQVFQFKPGQSGNIKGRPKSYVTILKELGYVKPVIASMTAEIMFMSYHDVNEIAESNTEPIIRTIIASAFQHCNYSGGDFNCIQPYLKILFEKPLPYIPKPLLGKATTENENPQ